MEFRKKIWVTSALVAIAALLLVSSAAAASQSAQTAGVPSLVELYWQSSKTVSVPGITNLIILDPEIARAETGADTVQFFGLERGETVALGYLGEKPVSIRIRVIPRPAEILSPAALRRQAEMAQGSVSSNLQVSDINGVTTYSVLNGFSWSQLAGSDGRFNVTTQVEDNDLAGGHAFNIRHGNISFVNPRMEVQALDYVVSLTNNGQQRYLSPFSFSDSVELRGAELSLKRGDNQYTFFGGTTVPFYYLTLGATRDIGGFSFLHKQSESLSMFATTSYINTPIDFLGVSGQRRNNYMQTAGFNYRPAERWTLSGTGGISNRGGMGRGELDYVAHNVTLFVAGSQSSSLFPLNQIFSLFSNTSSIKAGLTLNSSPRFTEYLFYQHASNQGLGNLIHAGTSDYLSPALLWKLTHSQDLNLTYTYSHNDGGFTNQSSSGNRVDTTWVYRFTPTFSNGAQLIVGSVQDPLQLSSEDELTLRDSLIFPVKSGNMQLAFQHSRTNPSLLQKLNSELNLLSPALQGLFLKDPLSFVDGGNVPPEVRALLNAQVPINTSFSAAGQLHPGRKLLLSPNFSVARASNGTVQSWTPFVGYSLAYQATQTLQFNSGLTHVWVFNSAVNAVQRTSLFYFGFTKNFSAMPSSILPGGHNGHVIEGRVFRDDNLNGFFNDGERGFVGIRVELENGESTLTDEQGRFRFSGVKAGEHTVSVSLAQFNGPVRMTTKSEAEVDVIRQPVAVVNFGVINFARLMGNVYNDLRFEGRHQLDSRGVGEVHLTLDNGRQKRTITSGSGGTFEVNDVPPGDYTLTVDASTVPANYVLDKDTFAVHIAPVSTVVQDVALRALRSISGKVFLKVLNDTTTPPPDSGKLKIGGMPPGSVHNQRGGQAGGKLGQAGGQVSHGIQQGAGGGAASGEFNLVPLAGVQLSAGPAVAQTDENGKFLLRDLPAGELLVTIVPLKPVPEGTKVPSGQVRMPAEPIQVEGATIVITNNDLLPYLLDDDHIRNLSIKNNEPPADHPDASGQPPAASQPESPLKGNAGNVPRGKKQFSTLPLGNLSIYEQQKVTEFTFGLTSCLLRHDCQNLQDSITTTFTAPAAKSPR